MISKYNVIRVPYIQPDSPEAATLGKILLHLRCMLHAENYNLCPVANIKDFKRALLHYWFAIEDNGKPSSLSREERILSFLMDSDECIVMKYMSEDKSRNIYLKLRLGQFNDGGGSMMHPDFSPLVHLELYTKGFVHYLRSNALNDIVCRSARCNLKDSAWSGLVRDLIEFVEPDEDKSDPNESLQLMRIYTTKPYSHISQEETIIWESKYDHN